jgi:hypothetical protein
VAHGVDDKIIVFDKQAIIAKQKEIKNNNVKYYIGKGLQGTHNGIMFSNEAIIYQKEVSSELKLVEMKKGSKLTKEEISEFYKTVDHARYSEVNKELMDLIIKTFNSAL